MKRQLNFIFIDENQGQTFAKALREVLLQANAARAERAVQSALGGGTNADISVDGNTDICADKCADKQADGKADTSAEGNDCKNADKRTNGTEDGGEKYGHSGILQGVD